MKIHLMKNLGSSFVKSLVLFMVFGLIAFVSRFIFNGNLFDEEMLSARSVNIFHSVFLFLIFESTVWAFNRHATYLKSTFLDKYAKGQKYGKIKSVFLSVEFYTEIICILVFSLIVPFSVTYDCVGISFFGESYEKLKVFAIVIPVIIVLEIIAHLSVRNAWISDTMQSKSSKDKNTLVKTIKCIVINACIYCGAALIIPWVLPMFVTIANLGSGAIVFLYIAIVLMAITLIVLLSFYVRAIGKRRKFISKLEKHCKEHSIVLTDIRRPYISVFFQQSGIDFKLKIDTTIYKCKFVAGVFPNSPIVFTDKGEGICQNTLRIFKINIFQLNNRIDYHMANDSEGSQKIIIVLPVPKNIYVSVDGSTPRIADTGEVMDDYTLYTATGFLNALDRGQFK